MEAQGLIVSRTPVSRETLLSFKAYITENLHKNSCKNKRRQVRVLADSITPSARRLLESQITKEGTDVKFYRTVREAGCSGRFTKFELQPIINIEALKTSLVPQPPRVGVSRKDKARKASQAVYVETELKPLKPQYSEPKGLSNGFHILDSMHKLQQLEVLAAATPRASLVEACAALQELDTVHLDYVVFINAVKAIPFRAVNDEFTLPFISTRKGKERANCEWEVVYKLYEDSYTPSKDIVHAALKAVLHKDALSFLRYIVTSIMARGVPVRISELQIVSKTFSDLAEADGGGAGVLETYSREFKALVEEASHQDIHPVSEFSDMLRNNCPRLSVELADLVPR